MLVKVCNQIIRYNPDLSKFAAERREKRIIPVDNNVCRYLRFRAIGNMEISGSNGNSDGFPYEHFEDGREGYGYKSFINKRAHFEHNSHYGLAGSIGDLPDAFLNKFIYPREFTAANNWIQLLGTKNDSLRARLLEYPMQKDGSIEVLMRINTDLIKSAEVIKSVKNALDRLVKMIDSGMKLFCSMGTNVMYSDCTVCGNRVEFSNQYCNHLKTGSKGGLFIVSANQVRDLLDAEKLRPEWLKHLITSARDVDEVLNGISNRGLSIKASEMNHELSFFELSVVGAPAYVKGEQLEKIATRQQDEGKREYLRRMASEFGKDNILELYSFLQEEGVISNACMLN